MVAKKRDILSENQESGIALKSVSLRPKAVMLTPMKFAVNRGTSVPGNIGSGNIGTGEHRYRGT